MYVVTHRLYTVVELLNDWLEFAQVRSSDGVRKELCLSLFFTLEYGLLKARLSARYFPSAFSPSI